MKYIKLFEYKVTQDDVNEIQDLFQEIADRYFIKKVKAKKYHTVICITDESDEDMYDIFLDSTRKAALPKMPFSTNKHRIKIEILMNSLCVYNGKRTIEMKNKIKEYKKDIRLFTNKLKKMGYTVYFNCNTPVGPSTEILIFGDDDVY